MDAGNCYKEKKKSKKERKKEKAAFVKCLAVSVSVRGALLFVLPVTNWGARLEDSLQTGLQVTALACLWHTPEVSGGKTQPASPAGPGEGTPGVI